MVAFEGRIYVLGGWDGTSFQDDVYVYDVLSDSWSTLGIMPTARAYGGAVEADGRIYVIGGENDTGLLSRSDVFVPAAPAGAQWSSDIAPLPAPRARFGIQTNANFIFVLGGIPDTTPLSYNIRTDAWQHFTFSDGSLGVAPAVAQRDASVFVVSSNQEQDISQIYELRMIYVTTLPIPNQ
jgi:hypothetical protein